jgi:predicted DNA binding CopG/RHH family protein
MMAKADGTVSVKLDKAVYEIVKDKADKLGLSVERYIAALVWAEKCKG